SPVVVAWRRDLRSPLATGGRATAEGGEVLARRALAVAQVAASVVLLTGAGLLLRGFALAGEEEGAGPGFDPRDTLTFQLRLPEPDGRERGLLLAELDRRIGALPGVVDAGAATPGAWLGLGTTDRVQAICLECAMYPGLRPTSSALARIHAVSPGFFAALGAPVPRGRELGPGDRDGAPRVAVINDTFAARLFPSRFPVDPLGKRIQLGGARGEWYTVVGVVEEVRAPGIGSGSAPVPAVYLSTLQHPPAVVSVAVRAAGDPMALLPAVEGAVRAAAPRAALSDAMTMERHLARFRAPLAWLAALLAALAAAALLLATSGLHGVMAYDAARRTREIGVRMALGARTGHVVRMVLGQGLRIVCAGAALSLFGALALGRLLQLLLAGVEPFDPLLFAGIALLLGIVALLAGHGPARRAATVDPQVSLRAE
ncbi:MAG: ABC transporter permease, partial [Gemmatimonadota bacterium]